MPNTAQDLYLGALKLVNLSDLARATGRGYRTLTAYRKGEFNPSRGAMEEALGYLRTRAETLTAAADALEAALNKEERDESTK
jgi:hypothetical protein